MLKISVYRTPLMLPHQHCHKKTTINTAAFAASYSCYLCNDCMKIPVLACLCATSESARCRPSAWSEKSIMSGCSSASKASCRNNAVCVEQLTPNCMVVRCHQHWDSSAFRYCCSANANMHSKDVCFCQQRHNTTSCAVHI